LIKEPVTEGTSLVFLHFHHDDIANVVVNNLKGLIASFFKVVLEKGIQFPVGSLSIRS